MDETITDHLDIPTTEIIVTIEIIKINTASDLNEIIKIVDKIGKITTI